MEDGAKLEEYMKLAGNIRLGIVFYRGSECRRLSSRVLAVPLTALLM